MPVIVFDSPGGSITAMASWMGLWDSALVIWAHRADLDNEKCRDKHIQYIMTILIVPACLEYRHRTRERSIMGALYQAAIDGEAPNRHENQSDSTPSSCHSYDRSLDHSTTRPEDWTQHSLHRHSSTPLIVHSTPFGSIGHFPYLIAFNRARISISTDLQFHDCVTKFLLVLELRKKPLPATYLLPL